LTFFASKFMQGIDFAKLKFYDSAFFVVP
jgi:hypothetical protein